MLPAQRRAQILAAARAGGGVRVRELSRRFAVSSPTIRRDLLTLASRGLLARVHGGALPVDPGTASVPAAAPPPHSVLGRAATAGPAAAEVPTPEAPQAGAPPMDPAGAAPMGPVGAAPVDPVGAAPMDPARAAPMGPVGADPGARSGGATAFGQASRSHHGRREEELPGDDAEPGGRRASVRMLADAGELVEVAAQLVGPGMVVGISAGPTAVRLARALRPVPGLTVVTPALAVADAAYCAGTAVVVVGGVRTPGGSHAGAVAARTLRGLNLDIAFVEVRGLTPDGHLTGDLAAADTDRRLLRCARRRVLLAVPGPGTPVAAPAADDILLVPGQ